MKNKWLSLVFVVTVIISVILFVAGKGYYGMFDSFIKVQPDTTSVEVVEEITPIEESDTIYIYRVIVGSFKVEKNADRLSESIPFSDIIIKNGYLWFLKVIISI